MEQLDGLVPPESEHKLIQCSQTSIFTGAITIYECMVYASRTSAGIQRKKLMGAASSEFKHLSDNCMPEGQGLSDFCHPAILALARA